MGQRFFLILLSLALLLGNVPKIGAEPAKDSWTVYVYICGSDLESKSKAATADMTEIITTPLPENVKVLMQTGGSTVWHNNAVQNNAIQRFVHTGASGNLAKVDQQPDAMMSNPATLVSFLEYGKQNFPAAHNAFIFWDHGGGSVAGAMVDERAQGKAMTLKEMQEAFNSVYPPVKGKKAFDFIGFDACLMATIDVAANFSSYTDYLVASEETEPGNGWNYTPWLTELGQNPSMNIELIGKNICDSYLAGCQAYGTAGAATLSVTNLKNTEELTAAYAAFGQEALKKAAANVNDFLPKYGRSAMSSENYGGNTPNTGYSNMVDLGDLAQNTLDLLPNSAPKVLSSLENSVVYKVNGPYRQKSHGLSGFYLYGINEQNLQGYFSLETTPEPFKYLYSYMASGPSMESTVKNYVAAQKGSKSIPQLATLKNNPLEDTPVTILPDGTAQMQLSQKQAAMLKSVRFNLLNVDRKQDTIIAMGTDNDLLADWDKGIFKDNFQGNWGNLDGHFVFMEVLQEEDNYTLYSIPINLNGERVSLLVGYNYDNSTYNILGARKDIENYGSSAKSMIKLKKGDKIDTIFYGAKLSKPELLVEVVGESFALSENPVFQDRPMMEGEDKGATEHFAFLFEMTDMQNNTATSKIVFFTIKDNKISVSDYLE